MKDNILFTTCAMHRDLTTKSSSLIDGEVFSFWNSSFSIVDYLMTILFKMSDKIDWVINFDEDCFIFDMLRLYNLIDYMEINNFDAAGISDGGVVEIRSHNPIAYIPFFNIFNVKKIRKLKNLDFSPFSNDLLKYSPVHLLRYPFKYNQRESDYSIYFALLRAGCKFLYLDGIRSENDWTSTYLFDHQYEPFLIHTWFARRYIDGKGKGFYPKHSYKSADIEFNSYRINDIFEKHKTRELGLKTYQKQKVDS